MIAKKMCRWSLILPLTIFIGSIASMPASAQTLVRQGVLPFNQILEQAGQGANTLSQGTLAELQTDPYFTGNFQAIFDAAASILEGYTIVRRGGYFPENAGIPREQQLTIAEAVYSIFTLDSGNELVLFRTPTENTARYYIRSAGGRTTLTSP
jgi:hypothetical protein